MLFRCLLALLLTTANPLITARSWAQAAVPSFLCLPADAAWIAGIRLGESPADVERKLGTAPRRTVGFGEDDGGTYEEIELSYPNLHVYIVRGVVDRIVTTDPNTCTAAGVCPGFTAQQARDRLALISPELAATEQTSFVLCPEAGFLSDYYLTVEYTTADRVGALELVLDRP
jgi:hypothetical protein